MNGLESVQHTAAYPSNCFFDPFKGKLKYRILPVKATATITFSKQKCAATKRGWILYESGH